jgi:hypothetical protein
MVHRISLRIGAKNTNTKDNLWINAYLKSEVLAYTISPVKFTS